MARHIIVSALATAALAGCAQTPSTPAAGKTAAATLPGTAQCLFSAQVRGWTVLDDQTLLVDAPTGSNVYLFKLFGPVTGLQFQESLAFIDGDHNGQLCSNGDSLAVGRPVPQQVPIIGVRLLNKEEAANLRKQASAPRAASKAVSP